MSRPTQVAASRPARCPYGGVTLFAAPFQTLLVPRRTASGRSYYPEPASTGPVWALASSLAATRAIDLSFSSCGYLDVSVPRVRPPYMGVTGLQPAGLPHSDTHGSAPACGSPCIFAACRVLLRLRKPRHPPSALVRFSFARDPPPWLSPHDAVRGLRVSLVLISQVCLASTSFVFPIIVNERSVFSQTGCKDTDFFITSKFFCNIFDKFFHKTDAIQVNFRPNALYFKSLNKMGIFGQII